VLLYRGGVKGLFILKQLLLPHISGNQLFKTRKMKRVLLLLAGGVAAVSSFGQVAKHTNRSVMFNTSEKMQNAGEPVPAKLGVNQPHSGARTTSTVFYTQDFAGGIPSGWTTGVFPGGGASWKWTNHASPSTFSMGAMMSTTASNGWMIFDSDSIGAWCSCDPAGWLQTDALNCSGKPYVRLNFEDYYRKFQDSCEVWVSTSPTFATGTYTRFPVLANNQLATNISTDNTTDVHINISSVAGSQPAVYIRFCTWGPTLGAYSWMIDDMTLSDLDSVDAALQKPAIVYYAGNDAGFYSFGTMPQHMVDSVYPEVFAVNYGFTALPALSVNAQIFQGSTNVYNNNIAISTPVDAYDSLADYTQIMGYKPNTKALYTVPFGVNPSMDAVTSNNIDTTAFATTDSTWSENRPDKGSAGTSYVFRPGTGANKMSFSPATQFIVPGGVSDTLTSVSVAFGRATKPGQNVGVQIYHFDGTNWIYDGVTEFRALTSGEISTATLTTFASFAIDQATSGGHIIMDGGAGGVSYALVVKGNANTDTVTVLNTENPAVSNVMSGNHTGLADTSENDGAAGQQFGQGGSLPYYSETTPRINANFGVPVSIVDHSAVNDVARYNFVGKAYPNPANTSVNIPFTMYSDVNVTVTLSNVMGQVIKTQSIKAISGVQMKATVETGNLPNGVYLYSVDVNGQQTNGRIVVTH
jgi:hypothetical protein